MHCAVRLNKDSVDTCLGARRFSGRPLLQCFHNGAILQMLPQFQLESHGKYSCISVGRPIAVVEAIKLTLYFHEMLNSSERHAQLSMNKNYIGSILGSESCRVLLHQAWESTVGHYDNRNTATILCPVRRHGEIA